MRTALITGASKGIGRATARLLHARGWRVFAGYRSPEDGEALRAEGAERLEPLRLDVTLAPDRDAAATRVGDGRLDALINNAGIVIAGPLEFMPDDALREQFEVNVFGAVALTNALVPALRRARGRIVTVSSVNGKIVTPFIGPYAASKFAIEALTDAWRLELRRWGIAAVSVQPGAVATPIWETSRARAAALARDYPPAARDLYGRVLARLGEPRMPGRAIPPERVARVIVHAIEARRPRARYLVGRDARLGMLARALLPTAWFEALLARRRPA